MSPVDQPPFCAWHIIVRHGHEDDPEIMVMHPDCAFMVEVHNGSSHFTYACQIQNEIDNAGFGTLLDGHEGAGWWRARMRHRTIRGLDWSEIDTEYEVEPIGVIGGGS